MDFRYVVLESVGGGVQTRKKKLRVGDGGVGAGAAGMCHGGGAYE